MPTNGTVICSPVMDRKTRLEQIAREETLAILDALPPRLRERARALPVTFERTPSEELIEDGVEEDVCGLFVGEAFPDEGASTVPLPALIILFLENLWDAADNDEPAFRQEVRTTYLHELGHYLGLEESDLELRGLD